MEYFFDIFIQEQTTIMLFHFSFDDLIPLFTIGGLFIAAVYQTANYYFNRTNSQKLYCCYLWVALIYVLQAIGTLNGKLDRTPLLPYILCTATLWLSYLIYLHFIISTLRSTKIGNLFFNRYNYLFRIMFPICVLAHTIKYLVPVHFIPFVTITTLIFDNLLTLSCLYIFYLLAKEKRDLFNTYIIIGAISMLFFNFLTGLSFFNGGEFFALTGITYICLSYIFETIFFSIAISIRTANDLNEKHEAIAKLTIKKIELDFEKKRASDILLAQDFKLETERTKAIIEQRVAIGRKLHDDLSGSLVALKYLVQDFKKKAINSNEQEKFKDLETEINAIYTDTRNYSHELSANPSITESKISYDILTYLKKIEEQFSSIGLLKINTSIHKNEIDELLNAAQTKEVFFILKECITNTIKHTNAQQIWISIVFNEGKCSLCFKDDGKGTHTLKGEGIGMKGMKTSAENLKGNLGIKSDEDGRLITVDFNLD